MIFFQNQTTSATSSSWQIWHYSQNKPYKPFTLLITGTMGSATLTINVSNDNANWVQAYQTTTVGGTLFESTARWVQAVISGAGGGTSLTVELT